VAPKFDKPDVATLRKSILHKLVPVIDSARNIATRVGARPYSVTLVRTRWTGGRRGQGVEEVQTETPLEPTPKVDGIAGLAEELRPVGVEEIGAGIIVTQISARYTREALLGQQGDGTGLDLDESFWWEVAYHHPSLDKPMRRRFVPATTPEYDPGSLQWRVGLVKQTNQRGRDGSTLH